MPNYSYICDDDHTSWNFQQSYTTKKKWVKCEECGKRAKPNFGCNIPPSSNYPMDSDALGCHPGQIAAQAQDLLDAGIPTQFTKDGACIVESNAHRNALMLHNGLHDRDACYGQKTPGGIPDHFRDELEGMEPEEVEDWMHQLA